MIIQSEITEIDDLFGEGWFDEVVKARNLFSLPLEEQIRIVRSTSVHDQTDFFRNNIVLGVFNHIILPSFQPNKVVHLASVGCSTGQEVYSILLRHWKQKKRLLVHGYDSNPGFVEEARRGQYKLSTGCGTIDDLRELDLETQNEAFVVLSQHPNPGTTTVNLTEEAKKNVEFYVYDITRQPLPRKYDVTFLLNVLKHYTEKGRDKILANLYQSMDKDGWLVCEKSEKSDLYNEYMKNIRRLGFEKQQNIIIPWWFDRLQDMTNCARVYRKV
jgi:chemotaxis protein methyltransferase CheR